LIVLAWSAVIAFVTIKSYWFVYVYNPELIEYRMIRTLLSKWIPRFFIEDYLIIIAASIIVGALLMDFSQIILGWMASIIVSFIFSVFYMFLFVWVCLGVGSHLSQQGLAHLWMVMVFDPVTLNVLAMWFPFTMLLPLLAGLAGPLLREAYRML
jgi:hypothetical protein